MVPAKGVERWLTQRLSHRLGTGARRRRRRLRGGAVPQPALAGLDAARPRARRRVGPRPAGLAAARGRSTPASTSRGAPPWPRHLGHGLEGDEAAAAPQPPLVGGAPAGRPVRVVRRAAAGAGHRLARGPRHRRRRRRARRRPALAGRALAPPGRPRRASRRPTCGTPTPLARLRAGGDGLELPPRLSLFGHTRLPVTEVELLGALGERRDVHLWLPQPSPALWDALAGLGGPGAPRRRRLRRAGRPPAAGLAGPRRPRAARAPSHGVPDATGVADGRRAAGDAAGLAPGRPARQPRARRRDRARPARPRPGDRSAPGARLPRPGPPGRRAARGAGRPARGRPDPRAARHPRDVPRHRDLRAADLGRVRPRPTSSRATAAATRPTGCGCGWPTGR